MRQTSHEPADNDRSGWDGRPGPDRPGEPSADRLLLHTIVDSLPAWIAWKDADCRLQGCNSALRLNMERAGVPVRLGHRLTESVPEEAAPAIAALEAAERSVIESGEPLTDQQITVPGPRAAPRRLAVTVVPMRAGDEVVGVVSTADDLTEMVTLEESLAEESRLSSIGQLAAGVAHEINTPVQFVSDNTAFLETSFSTLVSAVDSLIEIAAEHDLEAVSRVKKEADLEFLLEDIPDAVAQARDGLQQIAQIVRAMKAFAHPGGEIAPTNVHALIGNTVDVSRNEWKYRATVELDLAEYLPDPMCDEGKIKQVLLNMIINAADAIEDAGGEMGVITIATAADADSISISISDTGTGMTPEVRAHIFERFFTTKGVGRGSGQGLAIAHEAITAHGGEILVDSTVGEGTTFTLVLPLKPPQDEDDESV